jgi:hypothetical protein
LPRPRLIQRLLQIVDDQEVGASWFKGPASIS